MLVLVVQNALYSGIFRSVMIFSNFGRRDMMELDLDESFIVPITDY